MTGRELIIYILQNGLEDKPVFNKGTFIGYMTMEQAAEKMDVGLNTVYTLMTLGKIGYVRIGEEYLVFAGDVLVEKNKNE